MPLFEKTLETSSQLAVRWIVVLVFALALLASDLGPRPAARRVRRRPDHAAGAPEARDAGVRLEAERGGVRGLHPVLLRRERDAPRRGRAVRERVRRRQARDLLRAVPGGAGHASAPALPAGARRSQDRMALAFFTLDAAAAGASRSRRSRVDGGHMRPSTAAALVGAGALSTLAGPLHGLRHAHAIAAARRASAEAAAGVARRLSAGGAPRTTRSAPPGGCSACASG